MTTQVAARRRERDAGDNDGGWSRRRLLSVLVAAATVATLLLGGLGYGLVLAFGASTDTSTPTGAEGAGAMYSTTAVGQARRNEIAAAPMDQAPGGAMNPTEETTEGAGDVDTPALTIPSGVVPGPALVLTGFPRTPEGAVGQLAAIETTVLQSMSLATAGEVYAAWALPGGAGPEAWPLTTSVRAFLGGAEMGEAKDEAATVAIEPAGAMVKGTDGSDWTLACVLVKVTGSLEQEVQIGYGYCERMQWVGGRWMIAPGAPPATAPSTWPGSPAAAEAGWSTWVAGTSSATGDETWAGES